jgi:hypothetical protein
MFNICALLPESTVSYLNNAMEGKDYYFDIYKQVALLVRVCGTEICTRTEQIESDKWWFKLFFFSYPSSLHATTGTKVGVEKKSSM